jgi:hypothetical protein
MRKRYAGKPSLGLEMDVFVNVSFSSSAFIDLEKSHAVLEKQMSQSYN